MTDRREILNLEKLANNRGIKTVVKFDAEGWIDSVDVNGRNMSMVQAAETLRPLCYSTQE